MKSGVPITPKEVASLNIIPSVVIDVVNELLVEADIEFGGSRIVLKEDIILRYLGKTKETTFRRVWFNFETYYMDAGWGVKSNSTSFTFFPMSGSSE